MTMESLREVAALAARPSEQKMMAVTPEERAFALMQRKAQVFANSTLVPKEYQNNPANCIIAWELGERMNLSAIQVMQNLSIIQGRPRWSGEFVIARINGSGILKGRLKFEFRGEGKTRACRAWGIEKETGERLDGNWVDWSLVEKEGWDKPKPRYAWENGKRTRVGEDPSKWLTMGEQMFCYRASTFWARIFAPEVLQGVPVEGEIEDAGHIDGDWKPELPALPVANLTQDEVDGLLAQHDDDTPPAAGAGPGLEPGEAPADDQPARSGGGTGSQSRSRRGAEESHPNPAPAAGPTPHPGPDQDASGGAPSPLPDAPATVDQKARLAAFIAAMRPDTAAAYTAFCEEAFGQAESDYEQYSEAEAVRAIAWIMDRKRAAKAAK